MKDIIFSREDIEEAVVSGGLLSLDIELGVDGTAFSPQELADLSRQARELGAKRIEFSRDRKVCPVGAWQQSCQIYKYSCLVDSRGDVFVCAGLPIVIGNVRQSSLAEIVSTSEVIEDLRRHTLKIKGPCRECPRFGACCGCRRRAFSFSGDYLASDPGCPDNQAKRSAIVCLPVPAEKLIPHRGPMLLVDDLDKVADRLVEASALVRPDSPFVDDQGELDEAIYMELMAQAAATLNGFGQLGLSSAAQEGFLLGAKGLAVHGKARSGDKLRITAFKRGRFENFGILCCKIYRDQEVLAEGEIKIWHK